LGLSDFIEFHCPYDSQFVNGLICLVNNTKFILWNPSINRSMQLPNLHGRRYIYCHGFGYHAPTKEYKAVRITYLEGHEPVVEIYNYTLIMVNVTLLSQQVLTFLFNTRVSQFL